MKKRISLVSNSSSSSFVVFPHPPTGTSFFKLEGETAERVKKRAGINLPIEGEEGNGVYLTPFISDCSEAYDKVSEQGFEYSTGSHCGPYHEEDFVQVGDIGRSRFWIRKEDYVEEEEEEEKEKISDKEDFYRSYLFAYIKTLTANLGQENNFDDIGSMKNEEMYAVASGMCSAAKEVHPKTKKEWEEM